MTDERDDPARVAALEAWHEAHPIEEIVDDPRSAYDPLPYSPPPGPVTWATQEIGPGRTFGGFAAPATPPAPTEAVLAEESGEGLGVYPPAGDRKVAGS